MQNRAALMPQMHLYLKAPAAKKTLSRLLKLDIFKAGDFPDKRLVAAQGMFYPI